MFTPSERVASIAVASFREPPADPDQARLADGFLEDDIAELARFPSFEVLAARPALSRSAEELEPPRIADRLGVTHLLDSTVLAERDVLRVASEAPVKRTCPRAMPSAARFGSTPKPEIACRLRRPHRAPSRDEGL